jgi:hypothetical protein
MTSETVNLILGIILGVVLTLSTLAVGNYLQSGNDEKRRNWEKQEREAQHRTSVRDLRMKDADDVIQMYDVYVLEVESFLSQFMRLRKNHDTDGIARKMAEFQEFRSKAPALLKEASRRSTNLVLLHDPELFYNSLELVKLSKLCSMDVQKFIKEFSPRNGTHRDNSLKKLTESTREARAAVELMKQKLEEISRTPI